MLLNHHTCIVHTQFNPADSTNELISLIRCVKWERPRTGLRTTELTMKVEATLTCVASREVWRLCPRAPQLAAVAPRSENRKHSGVGLELVIICAVFAGAEPQTLLLPAGTDERPSPNPELQSTCKQADQELVNLSLNALWEKHVKAQDKQTKSSLTSL